MQVTITTWRPGAESHCAADSLMPCLHLGLTGGLLVVRRCRPLVVLAPRVSPVGFDLGFVRYLLRCQFASTFGCAVFSRSASSSLKLRNFLNFFPDLGNGLVIDADQVGSLPVGHLRAHPQICTDRLALPGRGQLPARQVEIE